ncbi:DUF6086 family protein [Streptomyces sp. NPDC087420]|uniref:DUF6086 family protein n=1 Tax=Streptomyces sp. NPDC087420 TaxID=3365785 RepID=UPI0038329BEB
MSCFFSVDGVDVWNPSNRVARLFTGQAEVAADVYGVGSGLGGIVDDECEVDREIFSQFIDTLVAKHRESNNQVLRVLLEGVIPVGLVLLDRAGETMDGMDAEAIAYWRERRITLSRSMPPG